MLTKSRDHDYGLAKIACNLISKNIDLVADWSGAWRIVVLQDFLDDGLIDEYRERDEAHTELLVAGLSITILKSREHPQFSN